MKYIVNPNQLTITSAVGGEPVSLTQMKLHLKVDHTADDSLITALIQASREYVEKKTARALVERTYRADIPWFVDEMWLPFPPLQSIVSVKYYNTDSPSVLTALSDTASSPLVTTADYRVDLPKGRILRAYGAAWPDIDPRHDAVQITFKAGHAPTGSPLDYTADIEEALRAAVKLVCGDLYENREAQTVGQGFTAIENKTVTMLLDSYRHVL